MEAILKKDQKTAQRAASSNSLVQRYLDFCDRQATYSMAWFLFPALILPCLFMPAALYFMITYKAVGLLAFIFVSMMLFMGGMIANVGGKDTRVTISIFFLAVVWNILFPLLTIALFS